MATGNASAPPPRPSGPSPAASTAPKFTNISSAAALSKRRRQPSRHQAQVPRGLPASTSTESLDILDDCNMVTSFTIIGGEYCLRNYRSVTTVTEFNEGPGPVRSVVIKSYVVDVPEGNTEDDTRMFVDTVVRLNLQKLASLVKAMPLEEYYDENKK